MADANSNTDELWKVIKEFPDYEVSTLGRVRRMSSGGRGYSMPGRPIKTSIDRTGRVKVKLFRDGSPYHTTAHRLVAKTFLGDPPIDKPEVNHKNGNPLDNTPSNLEWCNRQENHLHSINELGKGRGENHGLARLTDSDIIEIHNLRMSGISPIDLASQFGVTKSHIKKILNRQTWTHITKTLPNNYPLLLKGAASPHYRPKEKKKVN